MEKIAPLEYIVHASFVGHATSGEEDCMYYQTSGSGGSNNGWNSSSNRPCTVTLKYICEKRH